MNATDSSGTCAPWAHRLRGHTGSSGTRAPHDTGVPHTQVSRTRGLLGHMGSSTAQLFCCWPFSPGLGAPPGSWGFSTASPSTCCGHTQQPLHVDAHLLPGCDRCGLNWRHQDSHSPGAKTTPLALTLLLATPQSRAAWTLQKDPSGARRRLQLKGPLLSGFEAGPTTSDPGSGPRQPGGRPQEGGCGQNQCICE